MEYPWYKNAILYGLDVHNYQDSDGDGCGDFQGLIQRLDYIQELGVTCLWLLPYYPSPFLDNGYDISDYYQVDRQTGSLENLADFVDKARQRGIRVLADLVLNHTSDQHPWFQAGRRDPHSRFHDYYVWSDEPVEVPENQQPIFPGEESSVWQYDAVANAYFYHRFYHFQPELNMANPAVQGEVTKALDYWLSFGLSGFRLDAASHMIEAKGLPGTAPDQPHQVLRRFHHFLVGRRPDAVLMGETDVDLERIPEFFAGGEELSMLMNFLTSEYAALALATGQAEQFSEYLQNLPPAPEEGAYVNFLRNLDELDLERLSSEEREKVLEIFAPQESMRIYGRGLRRRLAPMLDGDSSRIRLAFSLLFSLPGAPMFVYGDEIGMGEDLSLDGRNAVRTPMQWSDSPNGGFSTARQEELVLPVIDQGRYGYSNVNVEVQRKDPNSQLNWMKELIAVRKRLPVIGWGKLQVLETGNPAVFAHHIQAPKVGFLALHNLAGETCHGELQLQGDAYHLVFGEESLDQATKTGRKFHLPPYGYSWYSQQD